MKGFDKYSIEASSKKNNLKSQHKIFLNYLEMNKKKSKFRKEFTRSIVFNYYFQIMKLKTKLLALVILPVLICTTIAVTIASLKIKKQGIEGLEDKSSAILALNIQEFLAHHINATSVVEIDTSSGLSQQDELFIQHYKFRISSLEPENPRHLAIPKDYKFFEQFEKEKNRQINYIDKESNNLMVMRPVLMDKNKGCLDCHTNTSTSKNKDSVNAIRGLFIATSSMEHTNSQVKYAIIDICLFGFIIMIIAIILGYLVVSRINSTVKQINLVSRKVAEGDLQQKVIINSKDELGELGIYINKMIFSIKEVLQGVHMAVNKLSLSTKEIAKTSNTISQGANESASSIEEVSSTMEEMAANIQQNTDNSRKTNEISNNGAEEILHGGKAVNEIIIMIKTIADKISVISEIANKTDLLAINANIVASHAGEQGKDFEVIALEVRKLAERCDIAAKEISELSYSSVKIAESTGKLFEEIVPSIQKTSILVQEITSSSLEQYNSSTHINNAMYQLNQVSQQNATASEELAANAQELSIQADQLKDLISFFKLDMNTKNEEPKSSQTSDTKSDKGNINKKNNTDFSLTNNEDEEFQNF
jgi:methyl-accepting chemotaxis protein